MIRKLVVCAIALTAPVIHAQQISDPDFDTRVANPLYRHDGPTVVIDQAHGNFHTADGRYKPFADLLRADGYRVVAGAARFEPSALKDTDVLVISNAGQGATTSAFSEAECDAVRDWVRDGGSLLLIADHTPFGKAASVLAGRFGVKMGEGYVFEAPIGTPGGEIAFSTATGTLASHVIVSGRDASETVKEVASFTGQSLEGPPESISLLRLGAASRESPGLAPMQRELAALRAGGAVGKESVSAAGRSQGLVMAYGKGRVAVFGEAAMFSAQIATIPGVRRPIRAGMNVPGYDNRQFALNLLHWLSRALP